MCVVTRKCNCVIALQVETCSMYTLNVNFEKLNFGPRKNDYSMYVCIYVRDGPGFIRPLHCDSEI
jgi:hypothetical protein